MSALNRKKRGTQSPLDALTESVKRELDRRVNSMASFAETRAWLAREHEIKISERALSDWRVRRFHERIEAEKLRENEGPMRSVSHGGFEIVVIAPGATEVRVSVRPIFSPT